MPSVTCCARRWSSALTRWLSRATAGVYNQCLVFAMTGRANDVKRAMQSILVPTLSDAVELATGRLRSVHVRA